MRERLAQPVCRLEQFRQPDIGGERAADRALGALGGVVDARLVGIHGGAVDDRYAWHAGPRAWRVRREVSMPRFGVSPGWNARITRRRCRPAPPCRGSRAPAGRAAASARSPGTRARTERAWAGRSARARAHWCRA